jgi:NitT/TauT family transport system permease protein
VLVWELLVAGLSIRPYLLPAPTEILAAGTDDIDVLIRHGSITLYETLLGFGLAAVVGIALATAMFYSERLSFVLLPTLAAANAAPKIAFAPILIIWLGLGFESKIVMSFLLSFFPIVINTSRGLAGVPQELVDLFKLLQASRAQAFRKVRIPFAYPAMFDGFKIALPLALIGSIVMEFFGGTAGRRDGGDRLSDNPRVRQLQYPVRLRRGRGRGTVGHDHVPDPGRHRAHRPARPAAVQSLTRYQEERRP